MKEFFRGPIWSTEAARRTWEPRLAAVVASWGLVERLSVAEGIRPSALLSLSPDALPELSAWAARAGLAVSVLAAQPLGTTYAAAAPSSGPAGLRVAVHARELGADWHRAWLVQDDDVIGSLLGFPECCRRFFAATWGRGLRDTTWEMAGRDQPGHPECSPLLRWLGVRLVPHLPCSFRCDSTRRLGRQLLDLWRAHEPSGAGWALDMLSWFALWTALHGVFEVTTDVLKFCGSSDYSAELREFDWRPESIAAEDVA